MSLAEIHDEQSIVIVLLGKVSQDKAGRTQHCAIDAAEDLFSKPRVLAPKFEKINMQIVEFPVFFALGEIEFAARECVGIIGYR